MPGAMGLTAPMLDVGPLTAGPVSLLPMTEEHATGLLAAAVESRETYAFTHVPSTEDEARGYVATALRDHRDGVAVPFVVRDDRIDRVVGSTRYLDIECWPSPPGRGAGVPAVVEIGSTWLASSAQRTGINVAMKILMLTQAFEVWEVLRVTLKTDARNARSRAAIERIGASFEGVRCAHTVAADGTVRDTAYFSILADEWPAARALLAARATRHRSPESG